MLQAAPKFRSRSDRSDSPPIVRDTPVLTLQGSELGMPVCTQAVALKLESQQLGGSMDTRAGVAYASSIVGAKTIVSACDSNRQMGLAAAAQRLGLRARLFLCPNTPLEKRAIMRSFGAEIVVSSDAAALRMRAARAFARDYGGVSDAGRDHASAFKAYRRAAEAFANQAPLHTLYVGVCRGAQIAGIADALHGHVRIVAVVAKRAPAFALSLAANRRVRAHISGVTADAPGMMRCGRKALRLANSKIDGVIMVSDAEIVDAQKRLWSVCRVGASPDGVLGFAGLLSGRDDPQMSKPHDRLERGHVGAIITRAAGGLLSFDQQGRG